MRRYIRYHGSALSGILSLCLVLLGYVLIGFSEEPAPSTAPTGDPTDVQERAVIRDFRTQPQITPLQKAPPT